MAVSFAMLGILLMLDICFIVNYFFIRSLRRWTNKNNLMPSATKASSKAHSSDVLANSFQGVFDTDLTFAWILGKVKLDPLQVKQFPGWRPIPYNIGICTTCIFVVLGTVLLSPDIVKEQVGVSAGTLDANLCVQENFNQGVNDFESYLLNVTNLDIAKKQHRYLVDYHAALVNDTSLYGVGPHECRSHMHLSGKKSEWDQPGSFFPGYCERALEAAIEAAKHRQCTEQVCDCPNLPNNTVFRVAGLADKKYCGEVCIEVPYPCPKHTADLAEDLADYRFQQYEAAEAAREQAQKNRTFPTAIFDDIQSTAVSTAEKILFQVDVASYIYIGYSCIALFFPSPLVLFRMPWWVVIKRFLFGVEKPFFIISVVAIWWGLEYFHHLWYSPDIRLFLNNLRVGDPCFVDVSYLVERQKIFNGVCEELVPLEAEWNSSAITVNDILAEVEIFVNDCDCPFPNQYISNLSDYLLQANFSNEIGFNSTLDLCNNGSWDDGFDNCNIIIPDKNIEYYGNASICYDDDASRRLILEAPAEVNPDWYDLLIASGFLATLVVKIAVANFGLSLMTLADPFVVCAGEFLWMPASFGMQFKSNGQQERILLDSLTGGELLPAVLCRWFESKHRALFHVGLSKSLIWGLLMHLSMYNLFNAVYEEIGENTTLGQALEQKDLMVLGACLGFACLVAGCGIYAISSLPNPKKEYETADDSDSDDESEGKNNTSNVTQSNNVNGSEENGIQWRLSEIESSHAYDNSAAL